MPIYDYRCGDCGKVWEVLQRTRTDGPAICPCCSSERVERLLSAPYVMKGASNHGATCCGREERCDRPPCSGEGECCRR